MFFSTKKKENLKRTKNNNYGEILKRAFVLKAKTFLKIGFKQILPIWLLPNIIIPN